MTMERNDRIQLTKLLPDFLNYSPNHLLADFLSYQLSPLTSYLPLLALQAMGIPLNNLICASNENNILTEFFRAGSYNMASRRLKQTISPSIDILKSSNLERLLYHATEANGAAVANWMASLEQDKYFKVKLTTSKRASRRCDFGPRMLELHLSAKFSSTLAFLKLYNKCCLGAP